MTIMRILFIAISNCLLFHLAISADSNDDHPRDDIWNDDYEPPSKNSTGCGTNMRLFGPSNKYYCKCNQLSDCDFKNHGKCKNEKCIFGFRGENCQMIAYHAFLKRYVSSENNIFSDTKVINASLLITFREIYRIHTIKLECTSSDPESIISFYVGSNLICRRKCESKIVCGGDALGRYMRINSTSNVSISNTKIFGCSPFWFGEKCEQRCHCHNRMNKAECNMLNGTCAQGCELGRSGVGCQRLNYENVAFNKPASQSSTYNYSNILINGTCQNKYFYFAASLVVDGNTDQQHERRSCMHSRYEYNSNWEVDLGSYYDIYYIRIYNRNTNMNRILGSVISVDGKTCAVINNNGQSLNILDVKCSEVIKGRKIRIEKRRYYDYFNICEVEVLQCLHGFHGYMCNQTCPECKNFSCTQWGGECLEGCSVGYYKDLNTKLCTACPEGSFGESCENKCHCKKNAVCSKENGTCIPEGCAAGYMGPSCQKECPVGKYGGDCLQTCNCIIETCNKENGTCRHGCKPGYTGFACDKTCPEGKFGNNCTKECKCMDNKHCDKADGNCQPGGCEAGYEGFSCQKLCSFGKFGPDCQKICHCKNNVYCNIFVGTCGLEGCETGYKGFNCQEAKKNIVIPIAIGLSIILIIAAGIAICIKIKKSKKPEDKTSLNQPKNSFQDKIELNPVVHDNEDEDEQEEEIGDFPTIHENESIYVNSENIKKTTQVYTNELLSYVKKKKLESVPFEEDFLQLPKGLLYPHEAAKESDNKTKNRYKTILPYDHSRVKLLLDEQSSSDYINASYLTDTKKYIATQGPLPGTLADFWRMVLQTDCHIIVMLTNLSENGKLKSEQYWPEVDTTTTYGNMSVSHKREEKYSFYTYRQLCITKNSEPFHVEHYQFTSWPDHGVPKEPEYFLAFRNKVHSTPLYKPPILVHCSAGIGRSGTFIVLDIILGEIKTSSKIDVIGWILHLRKDRTLMVQNRKQLEYIYDVLVEDLTTGSTMIYIHKLPQVYSQLLKFPENSSTSHLKREFERLVLPFNTVSDQSEKGRDSICYENVQYEEDDENEFSSDNVPSLNGNNIEEEFILLKSSIEEKQSEFWNIIFIKRCTILVMLDDKPSENAAYWPEKEGLIVEYSHFSVELLEEQECGCFIKRVLKVASSSLNMEDLFVHQFQVTIWLGTDFPRPQEMVEVIQTVHNLQTSQRRKEITVHCIDGISKNGLFCVLYMIIEKLQQDTFISIAQIIRILKRKNHEIISDYMSYHYCWEVAKVFLEELSLYTNVSSKMADNQFV